MQIGLERALPSLSVGKTSELNGALVVPGRSRSRVIRALFLFGRQVKQVRVSSKFPSPRERQLLPGP